MEMQINELVSAIKKEGVEAAQVQADAIIAAANEKAQAIIADANAQAQSILKKAEEKVQVLKDSALTTAEHAKRDAQLFLKKAVQDEFARLLEADVAKAVNPDTLGKLILAAIADDKAADYAAEVAEVTDGLKGELAKALTDGLELKVNPHIRVGFRLTAQNGSGYVDCSDEELEKILAPFFPELSI